MHTHTHTHTHTHARTHTHTHTHTHTQDFLTYCDHKSTSSQEGEEHQSELHPLPARTEGRATAHCIRGLRHHDRLWPPPATPSAVIP